MEGDESADEAVSEGRGILDTLRRLVDAWNRGDTQAFADVFSPAAEYVTGGGVLVRGREGIAALAEAAERGLRVSVVEGPSVEYTGTAARARFSWVTSGPAGAGRRGAITCTLARHGTRWLIEALHNEELGESRGRPTREAQG